MYSKTITKLFILIVLIILIIPAFSMITGSPKDILASDNRKLVGFPLLISNGRPNASFFKELPAFFDDNLGLRNRIIQANNFLRLNIFSYSPVKKVLVGKDGWFFYNEDIALESYKNDPLYTDNDLAKWSVTLNKRAEWLKSMSIPYFFSVVPQTQTIYPEYFPEQIKKVSSTSRYDQLSEFIRKNTKINYIDPKQAILDQKPFFTLYYKADTHWNSMGAFIAYTQIMNKIVKDMPDMVQKKLDDYFITNEDLLYDDLDLMLGNPGLPNSQNYLFTPKNFKNTIKEIPDENLKFLTFENSNKGLPKAVIIKDSYTTAMIPFFNESFSSVVYVHDSPLFDQDVIDTILREKPDIVIQETAERFLMIPVPQDKELNSIK